MPDDVVAAGAKGRDQLRAVIVASGIEEHAERQLVVIKKLEQAPGTDPVAILAPAPVVRIGMAEAGGERDAQTAAVGEMLHAQREIYSQPLAVRPSEVGAPDDRLIGKAPMGGQHHALRHW